MAIYRAYRQPGMPFQGVYRPARIDGDGDGDDGEYSDELKSKCDAAAGPRPPCPTSCLTPNCKVRQFYSRVTYKEDYAAAQVFVCAGCGRPQFPEQWGPSEEDLVDIEAQRKRDRLRKRGDDHQKQLQRARSNLKIKRELETRPKSQKKAKGKARAKPFGIVGNIMGASDATAGPSRRDLYRGRTITVLLWYQMNQLPLEKKVNIEDARLLHFAEAPWVQAACGPGSLLVFDAWLLDIAQWSTVTWSTTPIDVSLDEDTVFVRVIGLPCTGFGHYLKKYEESHAMAYRLRGGQRPSEVFIASSAPDKVWVALWTADSQGPTLYQVSIVKERGRDVARWVDPPELKSAHHPCYWIEGETQWQGYAGVSGARVACLPGVPVILLRRPDIQQLFGLGDVLEYLENTRAIQRASGRDHVARPGTHTTRTPGAEAPQAGPSNIKVEPTTRAQVFTTSAAGPSNVKAEAGPWNGKVEPAACTGAIATRAVTRGYNAHEGQAGPSTRVEPSVRNVQGKGKIDKGKARDMGMDWRQEVQRAGFRVVVENGAGDCRRRVTTRAGDTATKCTW